MLTLNVCDTKLSEISHNISPVRRNPCSDNAREIFQKLDNCKIDQASYVETQLDI